MKLCREGAVFPLIGNVDNSNQSKPIQLNFFVADAYERDHLLASLQHRKALRSSATPTFSKIPV
jgi:hypothetical protein